MKAWLPQDDQLNLCREFETTPSNAVAIPSLGIDLDGCNCGISVRTEFEGHRAKGGAAHPANRPVSIERRAADGFVAEADR